MLVENWVVNEYAYKEGNQVADLFTNIIFSFAGDVVIQFNILADIPNKWKTLIELKKFGIPNTRIKKCQNNMGTYYKNQQNSYSNNEYPIT